MPNPLYEAAFNQNGAMPFICHRDEVDHTGGINLHWHEHPEILHCLSGEGSVLCAGRTLPFHAGDIAIINHSDPHGFFSPGSMVYDCLIVDETFCRENGFDPRSSRLMPLISDPEISAQHQHVFGVFYDDTPFRELRLRAAVLSLLSSLCTSYMDNTRQFHASPAIDGIKSAIDYIRAHYADPISLEEVAAQAGLSRYYFTRAFKQVTGQSFVTFLNTVRCEEAAHRMQSGATVTEAGFACGFRELGYFSRTFRKLMGTAPSSLRP